MSVRTFHVGVLVGLIGLAGGCLGPRRADYVSAHALSTPCGSAQADRLWAAAQSTLREHAFRLDRVDRRAGIITTMPEGSQHVFEFWRHDVDTTPDFWEATLNPIRRKAEITITGDDDGAWTQLVVAVYKQRLSSPDRQFNSAGAAYQYFGDQLPATTGESHVSADDIIWLDLGRDAAMEDRLLRTILDYAGAAPAGAEPG